MTAISVDAYMGATRTATPTAANTELKRLRLSPPIAHEYARGRDGLRPGCPAMRAVRVGSEWWRGCRGHARPDA